MQLNYLWVIFGLNVYLRHSLKIFIFYKCDVCMSDLCINEFKEDATITNLLSSHCHLHI